ncbi:transcription termination/antitermination protein NusG [Anaerococcus sp. Marseille-P3625]|uniref:transcription termination/antitermination protein NusG n=1 Tax=Anaerococcus sp. Marseille-P3625 TaxID=1977277 RepID=UPI000C06C385|nr:transcription termination/antitermination protein NusG [Anaerococcus sp. Marseille-P3625]
MPETFDRNESLEEKANVVEDTNNVVEDTNNEEKNSSDQAKWYVVHTYTGYENRVCDKIRSMIDNEQNPDIVDVTVPTEEYVEMKNDQKKVKTRKLFPGYVMVKMNITNKSWYIIRNTQGVTGFVGPDRKPVPLTNAEVRKFGVTDEKVVIDLDVAIGDDVNIIAGPFKDFVGKVTEIDKEKQTIKAFVDIFGRDTSIDLEFSDIETI